MSACGAHIRSKEKINEAVEQAWALYEKLQAEMKIPSVKNLPAAFKNLDLCLTHVLYLETIKEYLEKDGKSRGSYLVLDENGEVHSENLGEEWKFSLNADESFVEKNILEISLDDKGKILKKWIGVRPIPDEDTWFENVWNKFLKDEIIK